MSLSLAALLMAAWGLLQPGTRARAGLLAAALALGLAAATLALLLGAARPVLIVDAAGPPLLWAALHAAAGLVLVALIASVAVAPGPPGLALAGLVLYLAWPLVSMPQPARTVGAAAAWAALALLGGAALARVRPGRLLVVLDRLLDARGQAGWRPEVTWLPAAPMLVAVGGAITALAVPHLIAVLGGALLAALAGVLGWRRAGGRAWGLMPGMLALVLLLAWSRALSGPLGGWIPTLVDGPFSPRAAQHLALLALVAGAALAGIWPIHGVTVPVLLAPVTIAIAGTFATLLVPDGVQWWQPLAAPLALLAMGHSLARRRWPSLLVAGGMFGLWTGEVAGALGGGLLVLSGWTWMVAPVTWPGRVRLPAAALRLTGLVPAAGALGVLHAGLRGEVTWLLVGAGIGAWALTSAVDPVPGPTHIAGANPG